MKTLLNSKKAKVVLALVLAVGLPTLAHAFACSGPYVVMRDAWGNFYHQHFVYDAWGNKVPAGYHY